MPERCIIGTCEATYQDKMYHLPNPQLHLKAYNFFKVVMLPQCKSAYPLNIFRNFTICEKHFNQKRNIYHDDDNIKRELLKVMDVAKDPQTLLDEYLKNRDELLQQMAKTCEQEDEAPQINAPSKALLSLKGVSISEDASNNDKECDGSKATQNQLHTKKNVIKVRKNLKMVNDGSIDYNITPNENIAVNLFKVDDKAIVWMDMEMTGLDIETDHILEIACLVTDSNLNILATGPHLILHQPQEVLDSMNDWCKKFHGETGLTQKSLQSKMDLEQATLKIMDFLEKHVVERSSPLAGNSVYMDRLFLRKYMPEVDNYLHYRIIDVSTIKEICKRWNPEVYKGAPEKKYVHRALDDIMESINEMKYYMSNFFQISK